METVRSPSGIKTRGIKAVRKTGSRTKRYRDASLFLFPDSNHVYSSVQLALPIVGGPTEDDTATAVHSDVSEASNSSKDLFVPARRMAAEVKRGGSNPLKLKVSFS
jgi:hypothetical protein